MEIALAQRPSLMDPDADLVRRMAAGEEDALQALYAAYGRRLFAYALRLTASQPLAEEVLQDSLLGAWRSAAAYRGEARVLTWLLGIVHHQALNATRRRSLPLTALDKASPLADGAGQPERHLEAREQRRALQAALDTLSPDQRAAVELVFYQGLSLAEVAQVCRCPLGTVKSRLSYARARLRERLIQAGLQPEDVI